MKSSLSVRHREDGREGRKPKEGRQTQLLGHTGSQEGNSERVRKGQTGCRERKNPRSFPISTLDDWRDYGTIS